MPVIELKALSKWYGEVIGLNNVTADIGRGITGLVGPNGAGKSTLMGLAMGQLHPSKGTIRVFEQKVWNNPAVLSQIGYCPEGDPFWENLTGYQFVVFLAKASGLSSSAAQKAAREAIELSGMTKNAGRAIKGYSKGMRQRIKMAQALVHQPPLLILDEPFTGTDPIGRHELGNLLRELAAGGVDILISSHVLHEVKVLTKQILMIDHGRIVAQGDLQMVRRTLHDRPHAIQVRVASRRAGAVADSRRLAVKLAGLEFVSGLKIGADLAEESPDTLLIETRQPEQLYDCLPGLILEEKIPVREIAAADESLEAVFGYLTQRSG